MCLLAAWLPEAILFTWNALDAPSTGSWLADNWDVVPRFLAAGAVVAVPLTTLALLMASFAERRAYATVATLAVVLVGGAIGGIAQENFDGLDRRRGIARDLPAGLAGDRPLDLRRQCSPTTRAGWKSALWVAGVTVVLATWLVRRTRQLVRE